MGKKKSTWVSPKKQKIIDEQNRREYRRNFIIAIVVCTLLVATWVVSGVGIAMGSRPYYAFVEITGYGTVVIELNDSEAPKTVDAFVELARSGYYDGTTVFRTIKGKLLQAGFRSDIMADPIEGEFSKNGHENGLSHIRGTVSMSRQVGDGDKDKEKYNSATGQFFIMQRDELGMDGKYAAFGTVIEGMEIVDLICDTVQTSDGSNIDKINQPIIKTIRIERSYK